MLDSNVYKMIQEELNKETAWEFVKTVLNIYSEDTDNISDLLSYIPAIAAKQLSERDKTIAQYNEAVNVLLAEKSTGQPTNFFGMIQTCKALFPNGICDTAWCSNAERKYFELFLESLKNKTAFDYMWPKDWEWATRTNNAEWLYSVIIQNIDKDFRLF